AVPRPCQGQPCPCQVPTRDWLLRHQPDLSLTDWLTEAAHLSGLALGHLETQLEACPFATVHRTLRDDLHWLAQTGWLQPAGRGQWHKVSPHRWPQRPPSLEQEHLGVSLSSRERRDLMHLLESLSFLQPQLAVVLETLWQQFTEAPYARPVAESPRRLFVHLDYILSATAQERVDQHQEDLEHLWQHPEAGIIQFEYLSGRRQRQFGVTAYPVCFHYVRRAKYLTTYGLTPDQELGWWNYRLDRIVSDRIKILPWGDPAVPPPLRQLRQVGQLPTPQQVEAHLEDAWGFNFYLPKALLIMRFDPTFARWYVDDTQRHPTFGPVAYQALPSLIATHAPATDQAALLDRVAQCSPTDAYYQAWIRLGDTNVTLRLRDWRPNGEVIAPLEVRQQMRAEAEEELNQYQ
ncbi:MAG TPA: TIGR03985 family CRISPR-associated protein, partial [Leptolyngbyaceae cyanobacterium M65_K2018_010]|nr:TIGR03985 family CRISPR-associated protein [Leptolyngbyaceae cyanobacterium M65_K2018_010]